MQHFPIFLSLRDRNIVLSGGGEAALAKLRLLLKTPARLDVFAQNPAPELTRWAEAGKINLTRRALAIGDVIGATLFYAADENPSEDQRTSTIAKAEGALVNVVDNLQASDFITPAIVDRSPVTIAIGTEGAAPVLARAIKADLEQTLPASLGVLARIGQAFRPMADLLPKGRKRREFWADFFFGKGQRAFDKAGQTGVESSLRDLLGDHLTKAEIRGHVDIVGAGPGDPELLTLKARKALDRADVVIHDHKVSCEILELARREARVINISADSTSTAKTDVTTLIVRLATKGGHVVRLLPGSGHNTGEFSQETHALTVADIDWRIIPGVSPTRTEAARVNQLFQQNSVAPLRLGPAATTQILHKGNTL